MVNNIEIITFCLMIVSLAALNTVGCLELSPVIRVLVKTLTSIMFLLTGFASARKGKEKLSAYKKLVLTGLFLGLAGDVLLGLNFISTAFFVAGLIAFALGHVFYVIAFTRKSPKLEVINFIPMLIIMPSFFLLVFITKKFEFEGLFPCIVFYGLLLTFMQGKAFSLLKFKDKATTFVRLTLAGVTLFAISDIILLFILFMQIPLDVKKVLEVFNLVTYYVGQGFIALSLTSEKLAERGM